ncbi:hypothetical protein C8R43DRAFT_1132447 [Mycena crocata]|nr:hypothetical protein C8R43DRAFT_1141930 [Mycena crocata]KAJ7136545.1 hypothetical protein C8R43DRAFT_1132447 [Mycena crocata]
MLQLIIGRCGLRDTHVFVPDHDDDDRYHRLVVVPRWPPAPWYGDNASHPSCPVTRRLHLPVDAFHSHLPSISPSAPIAGATSASFALDSYHSPCLPLSSSSASFLARPHRLVRRVPSSASLTSSRRRHASDPFANAHALAYLRPYTLLIGKRKPSPQLIQHSSLPSISHANASPFQPTAECTAHSQPPGSKDNARIGRCSTIDAFSKTKIARTRARTAAIPVVVERTPTPPLPDFIIDDELVAQLETSLRDLTGSLTRATRTATRNMSGNDLAAPHRVGSEPGGARAARPC